ncbi:MAG: transposase [Pseudomonadota bacterium]
MMQYSKERKDAVLKKMMPPHNRSILELAKEEGISEATLYIWRRQARERGVPGRHELQKAAEVDSSAFVPIFLLAFFVSKSIDLPLVRQIKSFLESTNRLKLSIKYLGYIEVTT